MVARLASSTPVKASSSHSGRGAVPGSRYSATSAASIGWSKVTALPPPESLAWTSSVNGRQPPSATR